MKLRPRLQLTFALYSLLILSLLFLVLHLNINSSFQTYGKRVGQQRVIEALSMGNEELSYDQLQAQVNKYGFYLKNTNSKNIKGNVPIVKDNEGISYILVQESGETLNSSEKLLLETIDQLLIILGIVFLLLSQILAYFISKKFSKPVESISKGIQDIQEGKFGQSISCKSNITEYKQLCDTLSRMSKQLEKNRNQSRRYNQDIQHELRTPVTNLLAHLEAVQDGVFELNKEMIEDLHNEVVRLSALIDQIQKLEKIDDGRRTLKLEPIKVSLFLKRIVHSFSASAMQNSISIKTDSTVDEIITDYNLFLTIVTNILSNSIRYAGEGSKVSILIDKVDSNIILSIKDNGVGIEESKIDKLFNRFYRVDNSRSRETGGSGLGLAIVKASVELLNGTINVRSIPREETTFTVLLPLL